MEAKPLRTSERRKKRSEINLKPQRDVVAITICRFLELNFGLYSMGCTFEEFPEWSKNMCLHSHRSFADNQHDYFQAHLKEMNGYVYIMC
jgi:hypothetical protein